MKKKQKKQFRFIQILFLIVCVFSLLRVFTSAPVSMSMFSDTEHISSTFIMGHESSICAHREGFWRHHPEEWPVENITVGGVFYTKAEAIMVMDTPGAGDKTYDLFRQLVATMLNLFCGCNPECIQETVGLADTWLVSYPVGSDVHANSAAWKLAKPWLKELEQYNKGLLCEESCNSPPEPPRMLLANATMAELAVHVSDVDYDELTVRFYDAQNDNLLREYATVESDSNVSLDLEEVLLNESFGWYVIVSDQYTEIMSETWWFPDETNETDPMDNETSLPADRFDYRDLSPLTAVPNMTYTFQVEALNTSISPEMLVVYWYNETNQTNLMLDNHDGVWNASIFIASNGTQFWYRLYIAYEAGLWDPVGEHIVLVTDGGDES